MKIGIATYIYEDFTLSKALSRIAKFGFKYVEISTEHLKPRHQMENVKHIKERLNDLGLQTYTIHLPSSNGAINSPNERERQLSVKLLREVLHYGSFLGVCLAIVHPGKIVDAGEGFPQEEIFLLKDSVLIILKQAKLLGIKLAIENIPAFEQSIFGSCMEHLVNLVREIDDEYLGLCLDTGHCVVNHQDPTREFLLSQKYLFSIHVQDNPGCYTRDPHLAPTHGIIDWQAFLRTLKRVNYDGIFMLEVNGKGSSDRVTKECVTIVKNKLGLSLT